MTYFLQILIHTPIYAWIILVILIKRGLSNLKQKPFNTKKMLFIPLLFTFWGLYKLFINFTFLNTSLAFYFVFILLGCTFSFLIYKKSKRKLFFKNNKLFLDGSKIPIFTMLGNFLVNCY